MNVLPCCTTETREEKKFWQDVELQFDAWLCISPKLGLDIRSDLTPSIPDKTDKLISSLEGGGQK